MWDTKRFAVIILNFRTPDLVVRCLESFATEIDTAHDQVIVVDNASEDDSIAFIEQTIVERGWQHWVQLERSLDNRGFSAGNNIGIRAITADFYWLTNSDTLCRPGACRSLLDSLQTYPQAGVIGPRLEWPDGRAQVSCFRAISPISEFLDAAKTGVLSRLFSQFIVPLPPLNTPVKSDWISFASVILRRTVIEEVGLLDDGYFMFYEDTDYCRRAGQAGWDILYWPDARVVHWRGGSSIVKAATATRQRRPSYYYAARARYLAKFYGRFGLWSANLLWELGHLISLIREIWGGKTPHACQDEWRDIWFNWRHPFRRPL